MYFGDLQSDSIFLIPQEKALKASKLQKKRNLDTFLEEIKRWDFKTFTFQFGVFNAETGFCREQEDREGRLRNTRTSKMYGDRSASGSSEPGPSLTLQAGNLLDGTLLKKSGDWHYIIAFADRPGSHDLGDLNTTNLYLGNISPTVCWAIEFSIRIRRWSWLMIWRLMRHHFVETLLSSVQ